MVATPGSAMSAREGSRLPGRAIGLLATLLVLRVLAAAFIAPEIVADAQGYVESARRLLATGSIAYPLYTDEFWTRDQSGDLTFRASARGEFHSSPPNALTLPGYAAFIAGIWLAIGPDADPAVAVRLMQAVLSVITALLIYMIGRRAGERVAFTALVLAAVYPPFTLANSYLNVEVLYGFLLVSAVYLLLRWLDVATLSRALAAGVVFGAGFLVRPTALPWMVLATALIVLFDRRAAHRPQQGTALIVVSMLFLTPWTIRNYAHYEQLVPFGTSDSVNIVQALWHDHAEPFGPSWSPARAPESAHTLSPIAASTKRVLETGQTLAHDDRQLLSYYREASLKLVAESLARDPWAVVTARAHSSAHSLTWPHSVAAAPLAGVPFTVSWVMHCGLLALALIGATRIGARLDLWLAASVPAYFVAVHAVVFPLWRHYFPTLGLVCVIAAAGGLFCYDGMQARASPGKPPGSRGDLVVPE